VVGDRVLDIQYRAQLAADVGAVVHRDPLGAVDVDAQHGGAAAPRLLHRQYLETQRAGAGLQQIVQPDVRQHVPLPPKQ
jgi:hypothetical protein